MVFSVVSEMERNDALMLNSNIDDLTSPSVDFRDVSEVEILALAQRKLDEACVAFPTKSRALLEHLLSFSAGWDVDELKRMWANEVDVLVSKAKVFRGA